MSSKSPIVGGNDPVETKPVSSDTSAIPFGEAWAARLNQSKMLFIVQIALSLSILLTLSVFNPIGKELSTWGTIHSNLWLVCMAVALFPVYWIAAGTRVWSNKVFTVTWGSILIQLALIVLIRHLTGKDEDAMAISRMILPYILAPMVTTVLVGPAMGSFTTFSTSMLGFVFISEEYRMNYLVLNMLTGMLTVLLSRNLRSRGQLLRAGLLAGVVVFVGSSMLNTINFNVAKSEIDILIYEIAASFGVSIILSILISGALPAMEALFKIITPISWLELSDMNHKLLKEMQLTAPGTFHHCLMVAQLAEAAAEAVGANANYCRVASYYHDIGKLKYPQYFIENISDGEPSPHDKLTPNMSARIIIGHVAEGIALAQENKLNRQIIDIIQQHHGTTLAYFFYRKAMDYRKEMLEKVEKGQANADDVPEVEEENFRYSGPSPKTREIGIVSLADVVESATRSLHEPTVDELREMIDKVIKARVVDGHLDESGLTFGDLKKVRDVFLSTIKNMRHSRIAYPQEEKESKKNRVLPVPEKKEDGVDSKVLRDSVVKDEGVFPLPESDLKDGAGPAASGEDGESVPGKAVVEEGRVREQEAKDGNQQEKDAPEKDAVVSSVPPMTTDPSILTNRPVPGGKSEA